MAKKPNVRNRSVLWAVQRFWNLIRCNRWSFHTTSTEVLDPVIYRGASMRFSIDLLNDGFRLGSAYLVIRIANPYKRGQPVFDSHFDLPLSEKSSFQVEDVPAGETKRFAGVWNVPVDIPAGVYYYQIEVWSIPRLFRSRSAWFKYIDHRFDRTPWQPSIEVVNLPATFDETSYDGGNRQSRKRVFISYSWDSEEHQRWVLSLSNHLVRHGMYVVVDHRDLLPGEEITAFIERGNREKRRSSTCLYRTLHTEG